jgi:hypothetical protein
MKFRNVKVYSLEKYRKRQKIILCVNVYCSNHLIRQEKVKFILHLSFFYVGSGIRIRDPGSGMTRKAGSGIRDKHPGSATLVNIEQFRHTVPVPGTGKSKKL